MEVVAVPPGVHQHQPPLSPADEEHGLLLVGVEEPFALPNHGVAEAVHRRHPLVPEEGAAGGPDAVHAPPHIGGGGPVGPVEEEGGAAAPRADHGPALDDLVLGETHRSAVVAVVVVGLHPGDGGGVLHIDTQALQLPGAQAAGGQRLPYRRAEGAGGGAADGLLIGLDPLPVPLEHLAVVKDSLIDLPGDPLPEVVLLRAGVLRVVRQADVLGGVVAEAVRAAVDALVEVGDEVVLEGRILRVHVRQAPHLPGGALQPVVPLDDLVEAVGVVELLPSPGGADQALADAVQVRGGVVGDHVHDHLDAVPVGRLTHGGKCLLGAQLVIADGPVGGLVVVVPLSLAVELHTAAAPRHTGVDGGGLDGGEARPGDVLHALGDGLEGPAPGVEDGSLLHRLRQSVGVPGALAAPLLLRAAPRRQHQQHRRRQRRRAASVNTSSVHYASCPAGAAGLCSLYAGSPFPARGMPHTTSADSSASAASVLWSRPRVRM